MGNTNDSDREAAKWDPEFVERTIERIGPLLKRFHRFEVRGLDKFPNGGVLVVGNHSGGMFAADVPVFAAGFYGRFGYGRPVYTLSFDLLINGPFGDFFKQVGFIRANQENAEEALRSGGVVMVFPGGDYDAYRPSWSANKIDFGGRRGYVRAALNAGVPIVPLVGIGGHENQIYLTRGGGLAKLLRLDKLLRVKIMPISIGIPFGLSVMLPLNLPLPTKIVMQVLEPIDVTERFGNDPSVDEVDTYIRDVMQTALDELAAERRLPVMG